MLASARLPCTTHFLFRPLQVKAVSHRRPSLPRAGSPVYRAPRLDVPPAGSKFHTGIPMSIEGPTFFRDNCFRGQPPPTCTLPRLPHTRNSRTHLTPTALHLCAGGGEHPRNRATSRMLGRVLLWPYQAHTGDFSARNALQRASQWIDPGYQTTIWMMTCAPLTFPEDLNILLKEGQAKLCPIGIVPREYEALQFCIFPREP